MIISLTIFLVAFISLQGQEKSYVSYQLTAQINPQQKLISSTAKISFPKLLLAKEKTVYLRLRGKGNNSDEKIQPQIKRIIDENGNELKANIWEDFSVISFVFPSEQDKAIQSITVEYAVPFSQNDLKSFGYYLYPTHEASNFWYPLILDEKQQKIRFADYQVSLSFPKNYEVLTSGVRINKEQTKPDFVNANFTANHIEGFSLAFGENYRVQEVEKDGIRVSAFSSAELAPKYLRIANQAADTAAWYQKTYGFFPTKNIGIVSGYKTASGGYPMPNIFMIHQGRLYSEFTELMTAHELGHYYWGLYVFSSKEFLDWLMLANGIWIDRVYLAEKNGRTLEAQWRGFNQELFNRFEGFRVGELANYDQNMNLSFTEARALKYDYNTYIRHDKGAVGLYLQARLIGKEKFLALQKGILTEYKYRQFSEADFIRLLTEFGATNAAEFFKIWNKNDARLAYKIGGIEKLEANGTAFRYAITINCVGNVPYPVETEIREANGAKKRLTFSGLKDSEKLEISLNSELTEVLLDPDGILPIWNSSHPEMQAINIRAMFRAGASESAIVLATNYLKQNPNDEITRSYLVDELVRLRNFQTVKQLLERHKTDSCNDRGSCLLLINLAFVLVEEGKIKEAEEILNGIRNTVEDYGLLRRWQTVNEKISKGK